MTNRGQEGAEKMVMDNDDKDCSDIVESEGRGTSESCDSRQAEVAG